MNLSHFQLHPQTRSSTRVSVIRGQSLVAIWLAAALISLPFSQSLRAAEAAGMKPAAEITTRGLSRVDGMLAISGETIFSGSSITTEQNATATVNLDRLGRLELLPDSGIRLSFNETGVTGSLAAGGVRVSLPAGVPGTMTTGNASIVSGGDEPVLFLVTIKDDATLVTMQAGRVELRAFGKIQQLAAGQSASARLDSISLDTSQQQTAGAQNLSGGKKGAIFLGIGGAIAILFIALTRGDNNNNQSQSGCVTILSPTTGSQCP